MNLKMFNLIFGISVISDTYLKNVLNLSTNINTTRHKKGVKKKARDKKNSLNNAQYNYLNLCHICYILKERLKPSDEH